MHPAPFTLHPKLYTLNPKPHTLHPKPHALNPAPYTLHPTPYTLHLKPYTLNARCSRGKPMVWLERREAANPPGTTSEACWDSSEEPSRGEQLSRQATVPPQVF